MKKITALFSVGVVGVVFCLVMTIYTAVRQSHDKAASVPQVVIPTPALGP
jgi:hypothetical protein